VQESIFFRFVPDAEGWWRAKNRRTGSSGVIPSNYVFELKPGDDSFMNEP